MRFYSSTAISRAILTSFEIRIARSTTSTTGSTLRLRGFWIFCSRTGQRYWASATLLGFMRQRAHTLLIGRPVLRAAASAEDLFN